MAAISRAPAGRGQGHGLVPGGSGTRGDLSVLDAELEDAGRARGRFLKALDGHGRGGQRCPRGGSGPAAPGSASHTRLRSVLQKVARLESKVMGQKKQLELQNPDSGLKALSEEGTSSCSSSCSSGHEGGARGRRYWRNSGPTRGTRRDPCSEQEESIQSPQRSVPVKQQLDVDSEEEEMRELLERSLGFSSGNGNQKVLTPVPSGTPPPGKEVSPAELPAASSFQDRGSERSVFGRVNSPSATSRSLAEHTRRSPLASSMKDNTLKIALPTAGCSKQRQESLGSDRSEIKSLDELFSEGADAEDANSISSEDFRLNILSLDDLASDCSSEAAEWKQKGKDIQFAPESNKDVKKETLLMGEEQAALLSSAATDVSDSPEEDLEKCISEISEHLSGASSSPPAHSQHRVHQPDTTPHSQYSEDFESSVSAAEGDAESCPSPAAAPGEPRGQRGPGRAAELPPPPPPPPPCASCRARANPRGAGASPVEPVPIATALLGLEAPEALSSPQALLLHSLCRQHLLLTQHFIHGVQQLHTALLESLEREEFHYHSLEEAKEYIRNHKSPPLTMEQALAEIRGSQEKELK